MRNIITSFAFVLAANVHASAQTPNEHFQLQRTAATASEVIVADDGGRKIRGRLIEVNDSVLELETRSGRRRFDLSRVARVQQPGDTIVDGVLKGMGVASVRCTLTCEPNAIGSADAASYISRVALGELVGGYTRAVQGRRPLPSEGVVVRPPRRDG